MKGRGAMKYQGSCHCQKVRFEVELKLDSVMECNCSVCSRRGSLLAFAPEADFRLLAGENELTDYQFGAKTLHHLFCSTCGIFPFARGENNGQAMRAINTRCLEGVDLAKVPVTHYDGKHV